MHINNRLSKTIKACIHLIETPSLDKVRLFAFDFVIHVAGEVGRRGHLPMRRFTKNCCANIRVPNFKGGC